LFRKKRKEKKEKEKKRKEKEKLPMVQKKMLYKNASAVASSISFEMVVLPAKKLQKSDLEWSDCGSIT